MLPVCRRFPLLILGAASGAAFDYMALDSTSCTVSPGNSAWEFRCRYPKTYGARIHDYASIFRLLLWNICRPCNRIPVGPAGAGSDSYILHHKRNSVIFHRPVDFTPSGVWFYSNLLRSRACNRCSCADRSGSSRTCALSADGNRADCAGYDTYYGYYPFLTRFAAGRFGTASSGAKSHRAVKNAPSIS